MSSTPEKLPSGRWRCFAYLGKDASGKRIRKSFTADKKSEARRLADEAEDAASVRRAESSLDPSVTLGGAIDHYITLKTPVLSPTTVAGYKRIRRCYLQDLMGVRVCDLSPAQLQQAVSCDAAVHSAKTVRNAHGLITAVLRLYRPDFRIDTRLPQRKPSEVVIPDLADINKLISRADDKGDAELALAIMLAAQLGLRRSEICALTFADIQDGAVRISKALVIDASSVWHVKAPKSAAGARTIPLTDPLRQRLAKLSGGPADRLFRSNPDMISHRFEKLIQLCGVTPFRFHDLRHYNASVMISLGVPAMYITRRLGHASDEMVKRVYGHLIQTKQDEVNAQMSAFFKG